MNGWLAWSASAEPWSCAGRLRRSACTASSFKMRRCVRVQMSNISLFFFLKASRNRGARTSGARASSSDTGTGGAREPAAGASEAGDGEAETGKGASGEGEA